MSSKVFTRAMRVEEKRQLIEQELHFLSDETIVLYDLRFRVYMSIKSHLWSMFDEGLLSLSSLELLTEACDKSSKDHKNTLGFWHYIETNLPSVEYLRGLAKGHFYTGALGRDHLVGRLTQVFEVKPFD
jgi:hypothetical protein